MEEGVFLRGGGGVASQWCPFLVQLPGYIWYFVPLTTTATRHRRPWPDLYGARAVEEGKGSPAVASPAAPAETWVRQTPSSSLMLVDCHVRIYRHVDAASGWASNCREGYRQKLGHLSWNLAGLAEMCLFFFAPHLVASIDWPHRRAHRGVGNDDNRRLKSYMVSGTGLGASRPIIVRLVIVDTSPFVL